MDEENPLSTSSLPTAGTESAKWPPLAGFGVPGGNSRNSWWVGPRWVVGLGSKYPGQREKGIAALAL